MNDTDLYFTQTIVGAPRDVELGEPVNLPMYRKNGIEVDLRTGEGSLRHLQNWLLTPSLFERSVKPRRATPGLREWVHRYSLVLGLLGLAFGLGIGVWALLGIQ
jgi:hypothetical protein